MRARQCDVLRAVALSCCTLFCQALWWIGCERSCCPSVGQVSRNGVHSVRPQAFLPPTASLPRGPVTAYVGIFSKCHTSDLGDLFPLRFKLTSSRLKTEQLPLLLWPRLVLACLGTHSLKTLVGRHSNPG